MPQRRCLSLYQRWAKKGFQSKLSGVTLRTGVVSMQWLQHGKAMVKQWLRRGGGGNFLCLVLILPYTILLALGDSAASKSTCLLITSRRYDSRQNHHKNEGPVRCWRQWINEQNSGCWLAHCVLRRWGGGELIARFFFPNEEAQPDA